MELPKPLEFELAMLSKIVGMDIPEQEGNAPTLTIAVKAPLTKANAEILGIAWVFASSTTANPYLKDAALINDISFGDVKLWLQGGETVFQPDRVYGFRLHARGGATWGIGFKIDFDARVYEVLEFLQDNRSGFSISVVPIQQNLFAEEAVADAKDDGAEPEDRHETRARDGRRVSILGVIGARARDGRRVRREAPVEVSPFDGVTVK